MDVCWLEIVPKCVHRQQWCIACLITEVILKLTTCQLWTTVWLCRNKLCLLSFKDIMAHERECNTTEVTTTTKASNDLVRIFPSHFHLLLSLQANNSLM